MQLLTFAHKNEAAAFFHYNNFALESNFSDLYFNDTHYLLITGEGLWESFSKVMLALNFLQTKNTLITKIINLGVAGALRPGIEKNQVYAIRTSYAALRENDPEFHSYSSTLNHELDTVDCLSYFKRATESDEKSKLSPFASLIDRELWSISRAASLYKIPWESLKVVSDTLEEKNICDLIQSQASDFSEKLYQAWKDSISTLTQELLINPDQEILHSLKTFSLNLTFSQRHQCLDLIKKIQAQEKITSTALLKLAPLDLWKNLKPKDKSQQLIYWLRLRLTPQLKDVATAITTWIDHWKTHNIEIQMNPPSEFEYLEVKIKSYNTNDWNEIINHLQKIPRHELELILQGKF